MIRTTALRRAIAAGAAVAVAFGVAGTASAGAATFPGRAGVIAYVRFVSSDPGAQIWTVDPKTLATVDVSKHTFGDDQPSISPDGTMIAFRNNGSINTMTMRGGSRTNLTPGVHDSYDFPKWSPDGTQLAYEYGGNIGVMNIDGKHKRLLTKRGEDHRPDWSPDGTRIAFTSYRDNDSSRVFAMNADGSSIRDLSSVTDPGFMFTEGEASWGSDSQHLLIASQRSSDGTQVFEMSRDGSSVVQLTDAPSGAHDPVFSPNGRTIAYTANNEGEIQVFTEPIDGSFGTVITSTPENSISGSLSWQAKARK